MMIYYNSLQLLEGGRQAANHLSWVIQRLNLLDLADGLDIRDLRAVVQACGTSRIRLLLLVFLLILGES